MSNKTQLNFIETVNHIKDSAIYDMVCHNIGKIISFNPINQTAEIELMQLKQYNNMYYNPTILSEIPVIIYGGVNSYITLPDLTGTICVVLTFDRNIDAFLETGESYAPTTSRAHNITDSVALPTFYPFNQSIQNYDNEAINIGYQDSHIRVKSEIEINGNSNIKITSPTGITIDAPNIDTTGNLNVKTGKSAMVPCGNTTLTFTNGILTGVE